jgi:molecular chaperone DnaK (HSP70)
MLSFRGALSAYTSLPKSLAMAISNDIAQHGGSLMDGPTGTLNLKAFSTKLQAYEALYSFNRLVETTLESLENLERLGFLRSEDLNEHKIRIEHARAQANEDLTDRLQDYEAEESVRFERMESELEKRRDDPNDVFFAARDRKREIKQQITELQKALERQSPQPNRQKKKTKK